MNLLLIISWLLSYSEFQKIYFISKLYDSCLKLLLCDLQKMEKDNSNKQEHNFNLFAFKWNQFPFPTLSFWFYKRCLSLTVSGYVSCSTQPPGFFLRMYFLISSYTKMANLNFTSMDTCSILCQDLTKKLISTHVIPCVKREFRRVLQIIKSVHCTTTIDTKKAV
ncbi:hypothetical protein BpHYR1_029062 [Brachionus plicatilis]|uniref:Uncharacterized protein n=1 Tax=Brachionus plicatilis TaxID=10195 RepID=A0A3M7REY1_BRAPC|nr:hypothetical protein BpHYR1_029062 [Brachionus plicatilis]